MVAPNLEENIQLSLVRCLCSHFSIVPGGGWQGAKAEGEGGQVPRRLGQARVVEVLGSSQGRPKNDKKMTKK